MTTSIIYKGELRCEATHIQSGTVIDTDAPTDNQGKGEKFSPTDLLCVSLATCMITTMAIKAKPLNVDLTSTRIDVTKNMLNNPRRIGSVDINVNYNGPGKITEDDRKFLEDVGDNCPV